MESALSLTRTIIRYCVCSSPDNHLTPVISTMATVITQVITSWPTVEFYQRFEWTHWTDRTVCKVVISSPTSKAVIVKKIVLSSVSVVSLKKSSISYLL